MAIKIKARERLVRFNASEAGDYRYVMQPEIYTTVDQETIMLQVAQRSGLPEYAISSVFKALSEVMAIWATNGHGVPIPGLGSMRFGLRAQAVSDVNKVNTSLIRSRRIVFTPSDEIKKLFSSTSISITCYDRNGDIVKRVNSKDDGTVDDPDTDTDNTNSDNPGTDTPGNSEDLPPVLGGDDEDLPPVIGGEEDEVTVDETEVPDNGDEVPDNGDEVPDNGDEVPDNGDDIPDLGNIES